MKSNCQKCGRELGFFERSLTIENTRLGVAYDTLCSGCHRSVALAIDKIEAICRAMQERLRGGLAKYRYAAGDANVLIYLAVAELFKNEPRFSDPGDLLVETFFPEAEKAVHTRFDYLVQMTYKILRCGFSPALGRYGLDTFEAFAGYMGRECLFFEQQFVNCGPDGEVVYADLFVCEAGFVFYDTHDQFVRSIFVSKDRTVKFESTHDSATYDLRLVSQRYPRLKTHPVILFNRKDQCSALEERINAYNEKKKERIENQLSNLISNLNVPIEKDLRLLHPEDVLDDIPLDSVLVCTIKTLFEQDINQDYVKEAPEGLLAELIARAYPVNLERSGLASKEDIQQYLTEHCLLISDFDAAFGESALTPSFALLTPRACMVKPINGAQVFMQKRSGLPNDLYCGHQYMIFEGEENLYLSAPSENEKNEDGYYYLSGCRIWAQRRSKMEKIEDYCAQKAMTYYEDALERERATTDAFRRRQVSDAARQIFVGFGYLPFCIYDEWAAVERAVRADDPLMKKIIPKRPRKTGTNNARIFYAGKTAHAFERQAAALKAELGLRQLPVARGLLFEALQREIVKVCAGEFVRLCGDFITEKDSMEDAFIKYSAITDIETNKAYYLGLFIYYLMDKGILEQTDLLDHYDEAVKMYLRLNPEHQNILEFSELETPARRSFDTETTQEDYDNIAFKDEPQPVDEADSFLFSIRRGAGDVDTQEDLLDEVRDEYLNGRSLSDRLEIVGLGGLMADEDEAEESDDDGMTYVIDLSEKTEEPETPETPEDDAGSAFVDVEDTDALGGEGEIIACEAEPAPEAEAETSIWAHKPPRRARRQPSENGTEEAAEEKPKKPSFFDSSFSINNIRKIIRSKNHKS